MMVIGLTGKACAGKDLYAQVFARYGCAVVDVDRLGHQALEQSRDEIESNFGTSVIKEGVVDRKALGALVFTDPEKLKILESITHPKMVNACKALIRKARGEGKKAIILNAALLKRMQLEQLCDSVIYIYAPVWLRYVRCRKREALTLKQFYTRNAAQNDIQPSKQNGVVLRNLYSKALIHRQVTTYCDTMGIRISSP